MRTEAARASGSASRSKRSQANRRALTDAPSKERAQRRSGQRLFGGEGQAPSEPATTTAHVFVNRSLDATPNRLESPLQPRRPDASPFLWSRPSNCQTGGRVPADGLRYLCALPAETPRFERSHRTDPLKKPGSIQPPGSLAVNYEGSSLGQIALPSGLDHSFWWVEGVITGRTQINRMTRIFDETNPLPRPPGRPPVNVVEAGPESDADRLA
jgi:hypothetical protein